MDRALGDRGGGLAGDDRQRGDAGLFAEHLQLFLRGGAVDVERRHQHLLALLFLEQLAELGGGGGLARTLQADHHDHHRRRGIEVEPDRLFAAEHLDQRVVDDLDDLLAGGDRLEHGLANRQFGDVVDEAADDRQRDVGLEQRDAHLAHGVANVLLLERTAPTKLVEHAAETIGQGIEHPLPLHTQASRPTNEKRAGGRNLVGQRCHYRFKQKTPADETSSTSVSLKAKSTHVLRCDLAHGGARVVLFENRRGAAIWAVSTGSTEQCHSQPAMGQITTQGWWSLAGSNR